MNLGRRKGLNRVLRARGCRRISLRLPTSGVAEGATNFTVLLKTYRLSGDPNKSALPLPFFWNGVEGRLHPRRSPNGETIHQTFVSVKPALPRMSSAEIGGALLITLLGTHAVRRTDWE